MFCAVRWVYPGVGGRVSSCGLAASSRRWAAVLLMPTPHSANFTGHCPMRPPLVRRRALLCSACTVGDGTCHRRDLALARL
jgi:hypothetical protein